MSKPKHAACISSPLEQFKHKFCGVCKDGEWCKPNELRMLICVLCAMQGKTLQNDLLKQQKGASS